MIKKFIRSNPPIVGKSSSLYVQILQLLVIFALVAIPLQFFNPNAAIYPTPSKALFIIWQDKFLLLTGVLATAGNIVIGLLVGGVLGFFAGLAIPLSGSISSTATNLLRLLSSVPRYVLVLLLVITFNRSFPLLLGFTCFAGFVMMAEMGRSAATAILYDNQDRYVDMVRSFQLHSDSRMLFWRTMLIPLTKKELFGSLIVTSSSLWPTMMYAEPVLHSLGNGLGNMIASAAFDIFEINILFGYALIVSICHIVTANILTVFQQRAE